jgi:hypothetical protein
MIKRILFRLTTLTVLLAFLIPGIPQSAQERRIALIIGNGAYKSSPLRNPVNDATDIANALRNLGFYVILKTNANQRTMEESIRNFGKKLHLGGVGLFYFAGHGLQVKGINYLIPLGANIGSEADVKYEAVDAGRVLAQMEEAENDLNIVILDACRNNPFARSFRSSGKGLSRMDAPKGSLIAYATSPGSVAADGEGRNGIYTKYLLKYMSSPNLKVEEVLKQVRVDVINDTNEKQIPWESSSLTGDFYFASQRGIVVAQRPKAKTQYSSELKKERERLEQERYELEKLKIEKKKQEAERKRIEVEKKKLATIGKEIARDGTLISYATGVVYDKKTGLEWVALPDKDTTWYDAKRWAENLNVAGGGWRMPTMEELNALYRAGSRKKMSPLMKNTGWWIWSGETQGPSKAWAFNRSRGLERGFDRDNRSNRGFAVRFRR